jgi:hypothetical protein
VMEEEMDKRLKVSPAGEGVRHFATASKIK